MKSKLFVSLALILISFSPVVNAAKIKVEVTSVDKNKGNVVVALFPKSKSKSFPNGKGLIEKRIPANSSSAKVTFDDIAPGIYAVAAYHDVNKNGKLDKMLGIPKEEYGNSGKRTNLEPKFAQSKFEVSSDDVNIKFDLH